MNTDRIKNNIDSNEFVPEINEMDCDNVELNNGLIQCYTEGSELNSDSRAFSLKEMK